MALLTTKGFKDILEIGNQARPDIFDLSCKTPSLLYEKVVEIDERVLLENFCSEELCKSHSSSVGITKEGVLIERAPDVGKVRQQLEDIRRLKRFRRQLSCSRVIFGSDISQPKPSIHDGLHRAFLFVVGCHMRVE